MQSIPRGIIVGGLLLLLVSVRWWDATLLGVLPAVQSLWAVWMGLVGLSLAVLLIRRRWSSAAYVMPSLLVAVLGITQLHFSRPVTSMAHRASLTIASVNMREGQGSVDDVAQFTALHGVQVLVLLEADPMLVKDLVSDARLDGFKYSSGPPQGTSVEGSLILSKYPVTRVMSDFDKDRSYHHQQPSLNVIKDGIKVKIQAVHPYPPIFTGAGDWRGALSALREAKVQAPADQPLVMAGDFNAGFEHPGFRQLAHGMTDSSAGRSGLSRTWPSVLPFTRLDHILVRGLSTVNGGQFTVRGTDHLGVWAQLTLPA